MGLCSLTHIFGRMWICDWFLKADKDKDGRMNFKEVQHLLRMMNVAMNGDHAFRLFQVTLKLLAWRNYDSRLCRGEEGCAEF